MIKFVENHVTAMNSSIILILNISRDALRDSKMNLKSLNNIMSLACFNQNQNQNQNSGGFQSANSLENNVEYIQILSDELQ
jgi:hypothetical protein